MLPYCYKDGKKELYTNMVAGNESSCYSGSGERGRGAMKSSLYCFIFFSIFLAEEAASYIKNGNGWGWKLVRYGS